MTKEGITTTQRRLLYTREAKLSTILARLNNKTCRFLRTSRLAITGTQASMQTRTRSSTDSHWSATKLSSSSKGLNKTISYRKNIRVTRNREESSDQMANSITGQLAKESPMKWISNLSPSHLRVDSLHPRSFSRTSRLSKATTISATLRSTCLG